MKRMIICIIALAILTASAFASDAVSVKGSNVVANKKTTGGLSVGPHQGTLLHFLPLIIDGPIKRLLHVSIHLDDGPIITGEAQYNEKTDRYDIRTVSVFSSDASGKINEELINGYVVDASNALGFPAMTKGMWLKKPSPSDNPPKVTVFITRSDEFHIGKPTTTTYTGTHKGTMLHWVPAGSGTPTSPAPITIRLGDGMLVFGDAIYNEKTNCHDISIYSVASFDKAGKPQQTHAKGYVVWKGDKHVSCPNNRGTFASLARLTDKPIPERDEVSVIFTP